jgi:hypothetical protein
MRDDLSNNLVHLTKGTSNDPTKHREEALQTLEKILREKQLRGGIGFIKGSHRCVCFSEAPISKISYLIGLEDKGVFKYQPYGVMVKKDWAFKYGGRPVIYGPDSDYEKLPQEMQYRHVRFWLGDKYDIDHTWEREWRIKADAIALSPEEVTVVVPDRNAKNAFADYFNTTPWHYIVLSDLGVSIKAL